MHFYKIHNLQLIKQCQVNIVFSLFHQPHSSQQCLLAFSTNNIAVIGFLPKKCSKCCTVASYEYYFTKQISRTIYHRNLIDPWLESRKFPPYCGYILQIIITTSLLITACFFAISVKSQPKIQSCDVTMGHVTKFQKE